MRGSLRKLNGRPRQRSRARIRGKSGPPLLDIKASAEDTMQGFPMTMSRLPESERDYLL